MHKFHLVLPILAATSIFSSTLASRSSGQEDENRNSGGAHIKQMQQTVSNIAQIANIVVINTVPTQLQDQGHQQLQQESRNNVPAVMQTGLVNPVSNTTSAREIEEAVILSQENTVKVLKNEMRAQMNPETLALYERIKSKRMQAKNEPNKKNDD